MPRPADRAVTLEDQKVAAAFLFEPYSSSETAEAGTDDGDVDVRRGRVVVGPDVGLLLQIENDDVAVDRGA